MAAKIGDLKASTQPALSAMAGTASRWFQVAADTLTKIIAATRQAIMNTVQLHGMLTWSSAQARG